MNGMVVGPIGALVHAPAAPIPALYPAGGLARAIFTGEISTVTAVILMLVTLGLGLGLGLLLGRQGNSMPALGDEQTGNSTEEALTTGYFDVLSALRSPAVVLSRGGRVVRATSSAVAFGLVRGSQLVHPQLRELAFEADDTSLIREREMVLARGPMSGGRLYVKARVSPLGPNHLLVLVDDHTEARRLEEMRRDFVANVSHELKTPIASLTLLTEAVEHAADDPEQVQHFTGSMKRETRRLTSLVQDIIDLSRLQVADTLSDPVLVDIDQVIAEAMDRSHHLAEAKGIEIVSGGEPETVVYGDHDLLVTALRNLVDNAVAYSPEGTRVGVGVAVENNSVQIRVSDQGIGISAEDRDRIFERFYRVDQARSRATGGTGLGLSIVKHVVATHGGEVTLWSNEGEGSTFTLHLPQATILPTQLTDEPQGPNQPRRPQ